MRLALSNFEHCALADAELCDYTNSALLHSIYGFRHS